MRLWKVVILANLLFGLGLLSGYLWWQRDADQLRRELAAARQAPAAGATGKRSWAVMGIVRGVLPKDSSVILTHEPIPGLMGSMTMTFHVGDRALLKGLEAGDRVQFTLLSANKELIIVALRKETSP